MKLHNMTDPVRPAAVPRRPSVAPLVHIADVALKLSLIGLIALALVNPEYGHLEGKAPLARALTYPLLAFALPIGWLSPVWWPATFPWVADLLVTVVCFSDFLGNRLDLYDTIPWFDDLMHFTNVAALGAAVVLLTLPLSSMLPAILERALATGLSMSLGWEVFEYLTFVTHSPELPTAYADTLSDMTLGGLGAAAAALVIHRVWRRAAAE